MTPLVTLLLAACVASGALGTPQCRKWCKDGATGQYACCDDAPVEPLDDAPVEPFGPESLLPAQPGESTQCYYWCSYAGNAYCCGDASQPIPESHADHEGTCVPEDMQTCKSSGIFYLKGGEGHLLLEGAAKDAPSCASDGYCGALERCCASPCARRHVCLKTQEAALQQ